MKIRRLCLISGVLLILAIPTGWPYIYYEFLRSAIFVSSIIIADTFHKSKLISWTFVFGAIAFLFNPIIPIYLSKSSWIPIDFLSAILFFYAAHVVGENKELAMERDSKIMSGFAVTGYVLGLILGRTNGYGFLGAFIGGWIAVFYKTFILKE